MKPIYRLDGAGKFFAVKPDLKSADAAWEDGPVDLWYRRRNIGGNPDILVRMAGQRTTVDQNRSTGITTGGQTENGFAR